MPACTVRISAFVEGRYTYCTVEYQSVCSFVGIGSTTPSPASECVSQRTQRGEGVTLPCGWGCGGTQFGRLERMPGTLCTLRWPTAMRRNGEVLRTLYCSALTVPSHIKIHKKGFMQHPVPIFSLSYITAKKKQNYIAAEPQFRSKLKKSCKQLISADNFCWNCQVDGQVLGEI